MFTLVAYVVRNNQLYLLLWGQKRDEMEAIYYARREMLGAWSLSELVSARRVRDAVARLADRSTLHVVWIGAAATESEDNAHHGG